MKTAPLLLIDLGNSRLKWTLWAEGRPLPKPRSLVSTELTPADWSEWSRRFARHRVIAASVVPPLNRRLEKLFGSRLTFLRSDTPGLELEFDYPQPAELGADRIAAALAIRAESRGAALIISCGTAVAITVLDAQGRIAGGAIAPGLALQTAALAQAAAQLPAITWREPRRWIARSTPDAIRVGALLAFRGGVREAIARFQDELKTKIRVIVTGGDAGRLGGAAGPDAEDRPHLVFEGLSLLAKQQGRLGTK